MHRLIVLTLAVAACSGDKPASSGGPPSAAARGPDAIALRLPRAGGTARAYLFPKLDSLVWSAGGAPAVGRVLSFDPEAGLVALTDDQGQPRRVDLRLAEVRRPTKIRLTSVASANGSDIYGVTAKGEVMRMTPSGEWTFTPPGPAQTVYPAADGTVSIASPAGAATRLWRIRPPDEEILDSTVLSGVTRGPHAKAGDRLYLSSRNGLTGVRTRDLTPLKAVALSSEVRSMAPTPSGDRVYIAVAESPRISILDRYREAVSAAIELPGPASELRIDPLGQSLLAKPAAGGDSAWVVAIGTGRVTGSIASQWTTDLPAFAHSGMIATLRGADVVFLDGGTLQQSRRVSGGGKDYWYFFNWNGFRPRAANLDQPVTFGTPGSAPASDAMNTTPPDSSRPTPVMRDALPSVVPPMVLPLPPAAPRAAAGFIVSFAAVLNEQRAKEIASAIQVGGSQARVVQTQSGGTPIFRVIVGPFGTREEAERVGRDSRRQYWVYEEGL